MSSFCSRISVFLMPNLEYTISEGGQILSIILEEEGIDACKILCISPIESTTITTL